MFSSINRTPRAVSSQTIWNSNRLVNLFLHSSLSTKQRVKKEIKTHKRVAGSRDFYPVRSIQIRRSSPATSLSSSRFVRNNKDSVRRNLTTDSTSSFSRKPDFLEIPQSMERFRWLKVAVLICLFFAVSEGRELRIKHNGNVPIYNHTLATVLVEYASAVYMSDLTALITWTCSRCSDMTEGFEVIELVVDVQHCLQAFVGVAQDLNSIVIAFRGTQEHSIQNWIEDLFWKQLDLNYPGMPDAMVHYGFYSAYHNTTLRPRVLLAVQRAKELYGDLGIMVTGHSMGGAMASFCALDLAVNQGEHNVQVMTFGQPRVGNSIFASYFSKHLPNTIRITNENDMVPHLPPYYTYFPHKTYHHFPREVWLYNIGLGSLVYTVEKICDASGEDPACCRSVYGNSIADHLVYFGVHLQAETWGSCRIVMVDSSMIEDNVDLNGNFALSRDPTTSVIKLSTEMDTGHRLSAD